MMTAKEYWKQRFDEYPQTDADKLAVAMMAEYGREYARLQIEKDRERVKENVRCIDEGNINGAGESEEYYAVDLTSIDQTPIILD